MGNFIFELKGVAVTPRIKAFVNELKLQGCNAPHR
jgi:hypothetical protein